MKKYLTKWRDRVLSKSNFFNFSTLCDQDDIPQGLDMMNQKLPKKGQQNSSMRFSIFVFKTI